MKRIGILFLMLVMVLVVSDNTFAQSGFYLGFDGGISSQRLDLKDVDFDRNTSFVYGLKAGFKFSIIAIEGQYFQASHDIVLADFPDIGWSDRNVDYNYLGLNGKLFLPVPIIGPYLIFGYGYYTAKIKEIDDDRLARINYGLGVHIKLSRHIAIQGEGRYHGGTFDIDNKDLKIQNFTLTGGVNFFF